VPLILDTNALSAAADRDPSALEVVARANYLAVPVIVLGEYPLGIGHLATKRPTKAGFVIG
jgi:predicted nucleic acid-binding protein